SRIIENNFMHWLIDGLPAATWKKDTHTKEDFYSVGFPLGDPNLGEEGSGPILFNHYDFFIEYHQLAGRDPPEYRVVGVVVQPRSVTSKVLPDGKGDCKDETPVKLSASGPEHMVTYTYSVFWRPSTTPWATRWDKYLRVDAPHIHWFSLINSFILVVVLTGMVAITLLRALRKDIARYNQFDLDEDVQDDSGWKLVHGDVFRTPNKTLLLSVMLGSGAQLFFMTGATIGTS